MTPNCCWHPIETAPKDGTEILVWDEREKKVMLVCWDQWQIYLPGHEKEWGWCVPDSHQDEQGGCSLATRPSHWMHVPDAP